MMRMSTAIDDLPEVQAVKAVECVIRTHLSWRQFGDTRWRFTKPDPFLLDWLALVNAGAAIACKDATRFLEILGEEHEKAKVREAIRLGCVNGILVASLEAVCEEMGNA
jgi:hypothetical protein